MAASRFCATVSSAVNWSRRCRCIGSVVPGKMGDHCNRVLEPPRASIVERSIGPLTLHRLKEELAVPELRGPSRDRGGRSQRSDGGGAEVLDSVYWTMTVSAAAPPGMVRPISATRTGVAGLSRCRPTASPRFALLCNVRAWPPHAQDEWPRLGSCQAQGISMGRLRSKS